MRQAPPVLPINMGQVDLTLKPRALVMGPRPGTTSRINVTHASSPTNRFYKPAEGQAAGKPRQVACQSGTVSPVQSASDEHLSLGQIEALLSRRLGEKLRDVEAAFKVLDPDGSGSVSKVDFRKAVESFFVPITETQLNALLVKVFKRDSVPVDYMSFLMYYSRGPTAQRHNCSANSSTSQRPNSKTRCLSGTDQTSMTLSEIQQRLKHKIGSNIKNIIRTFQLFDYNQDGQIQQQHLGRILETNGCCLTEREFQRMWTHYSPSNAVTMSYKVFLDKLGLQSDKSRKFVLEPTHLELAWRGVSPSAKTEKCVSPTDEQIDVQTIQDLSHEELQTLFLKKLCESSTLVWRALRAFDVTQSGTVSQEDMRAILSSFLFPMSLGTFQSLTYRFGVRATRPVRWKQFLEPFLGQVTKTENIHKLPELPRADEGLLNLTEVYPKLKRVFKLLDRGRTGRITRADLRRVLEVPNCYLNGKWGPESGHSKPHIPVLSPAQVRELLLLLDPEHTGVITQPSLEQLNPRRVDSALGRETLTPSTGEQKQDIEETQVEGLLHDKLFDKKGPVLRMLEQCDSRQTGSLCQDDLKRTIQCYGLPLSQTHFKKLCKASLDPFRQGQV
ncbi:hypothetical protein UPYG_G00343050 [Umbra pygmaea]|uniref:EF-hand domain-containing protein n=1 Tax=Umbra pygmaea TaxID=75934 RepID=A0ABD0WFX9_UMBPY